MEKEQAGEEQLGGGCPHNESSSLIDAVAPCQYGRLLFKGNRSFFTLICSIALIVVSYSALDSAPSQFLHAPLQLPPQIRSFFSGILGEQQDQRTLKEVLEQAAMAESKTVIITTLNAAWAQNGGMIDLFLESFHHGQGTRPLLQHLLIVCVDAFAYERCLLRHRYCIVITTPGINFSREQHLLSTDYIKLMWRRIHFLQSVLQLNYSFIFTDTDVLWLRNPFPKLEEDPEADFQIACDQYNGKPDDVHNHPNAGFTYARANNRTVRLYEYWYEQRERGALMADQEVFNAIKFEQSFADIGLKIRYLDTQFFAGFCSLQSANMSSAITMHANCCKGLKAKLIDLRNMLQQWKRWQEQNQSMPIPSPRSKLRASHNGSNANQRAKFRNPTACPQSWHRH